MNKQKTKVEFEIRKPNPNEQRTAFLIYRRIKYLNGTSKSIKLKLKEVDRINRFFKDQVYDVQDCMRLLNDLRKKLYHQNRSPKPEVAIHRGNLKIYEAYFDDVYADRRVVDISSAKGDIRRAVKAIGNLSLTQSTKQELQRRVDEQFTGRKHRRIVDSLNQLLRYCKRNFQLIKDDDVSPEINYLTQEEFQKVQEHIQDRVLRVLCNVAFHTGARLGECFGLQAQDFHFDSDSGRSSIKIRRQMDRYRKTTKRLKTKRSLVVATVIPGGEQWIREWLKCPDQTKTSYRSKEFAKVFRRACIKVFPNSPNKWLKFHDLRHSYAIHLLTNRVPLEWVARCLGDCQATAERYYLGFVQQDEITRAIGDLLKSGKK